MSIEPPDLARTAHERAAVGADRTAALAGRAAALSAYAAPTTHPDRADHERLYAVLAAAAEFYQGSLDSPAGAGPARYLDSITPGLRGDDRWGVGYAPRQANALVSGVDSPTWRSRLLVSPHAAAALSSTGSTTA